jgi:hypothetical protein
MKCLQQCQTCISSLEGVHWLAKYNSQLPHGLHLTKGTCTRRSMNERHACSHQSAFTSCRSSCVFTCAKKKAR